MKPLPIKLFTRIRRHAAISTGNFESLFHKIKISSLPVAISRLLEEINKPEPDLDQIGRLIGALPEISTQVLKTVNSSLFQLRSPVLSIQHAVSLLGLDHIRSITLSFAAVKAVPRPKDALFDHQAFWGDSLLRALVARNFARTYCPEHCDDAFTAMLIADVALPMLLNNWSEYYQPVVREWISSGERLSEIEGRHFGWNHAQAGAWILQKWKFPEQLICFVGIHNKRPELVAELELEHTIALPLIIASLLPSSLPRMDKRASAFVDAAMNYFSLAPDELADLMQNVEEGFFEIHELMGLCQVGKQHVLEAVNAVLTDKVL